MTCKDDTVRIAGENFNSHAHVERDSKPSGFPHGECNFNSHAHVERDMIFLVVSCRFMISTHTLTWSVTIIAVLLVGLIVISTHTLTWSVTKR